MLCYVMSVSRRTLEPCLRPTRHGRVSAVAMEMGQMMGQPNTHHAPAARQPNTRHYPAAHQPNTCHSPVALASRWAADRLDAWYERSTGAEQSERPCVSLDEMVKQADNGDIVLFRCNMPHHSFIRAVCYTEFDHVAVVVCNRSGDKLLLESCVIGCCAFDLRSRVRQYQRHISSAVAWRRLGTVRSPALADACVSGLRPAKNRALLQQYSLLMMARVPWAFGRCCRFLDEVDGKPYDYNPLKIFFCERARLDPTWPN
jgi:hypothetical protein